MRTKTPPRHGIPAPFDCKPFRVTGLTENGKPFEPQLGKPGSDLTFSYNGQIITAQVWSLSPRPGYVWAVSEGTAYLVDPRCGYVAERYYGQRVAA